MHRAEAGTVSQPSRAASRPRRRAPTLRHLALALGAALVGCGAPADEERPEPPAGTLQQPLSFVPNLPYPAGTTMGVSQGWGGAWSHTGNLYYAIDFNLSGTADLGIHVLAVADGTVTYRYEQCACEGCSCNGGWGNGIVIDHGNGEFSKYTHLQAASIPDWIVVGTPVCRGLHIGNIGNTGNSSGPHLHFQFQNQGTLSGTSIPFDDFAETSGVPHVGGTYPSANQELSGCGPPQPCSVIVDLGTTVIDDQTDCFRRTGAWWWEESYGHDGHHWYTYTIDEPQPDSQAHWEVNVATAGDYQVEVFVPNNPDNLTQAVPHVIRHDGMESEVVVDQGANRGTWVMLGTYAFAPGGDQEIRIVDNSGEPYVGDDGPRLLVDAVRLTTPTAGGCTDECAPGQRCAGQGWEECGDFDSDPCLEWGGGGPCEPGSHCEADGACVPGEPPEDGDDGPGLRPAPGSDAVSDGESSDASGCTLHRPGPTGGRAAGRALWGLLLGAACAGRGRRGVGRRPGRARRPVVTG